MIGKKIVCMRKNAEINCLTQWCIWKKLSAGTTYVMQDLGILKKIVCTAEVEEKKLASAQSMVEKSSCFLESTILPGGKYWSVPYHFPADFNFRASYLKNNLADFDDI